jgi:DNA polymerase III sliding clamp (beta) subunit (PCNA family)
MKFWNRKIELAAAKKDVRYYLQDLYLDVINKTLTATNGHKLVQIPVEVDKEDKSGLVSTEMIKHARKNSAGGSINADKLCYINLSEPDKASGHGLTVLRDTQSKFPDTAKVIPDINNRKHLQIAVDAKQLYEIAQAINLTTAEGKDHVVLNLSKSPNDSILVTSTDSSNAEALGVLMPVKLKT